MRLPFLKPKPATAAAPKERRRASPAGDEGGEVAVARARARRRLVGALVLLVIGVLGFPLLFETQPRPLPGNTPIEVAAHEGAAPARRAPTPVTAPTPRPVTSETQAPAVTEPVPDRPASAAAVVPPKPVAAPVTAPAVPAKPTAVAASTPATVAAAASRPPVRTPAAEPIVPAATSAGPAPAAASGAARFVVQVGAYTDDAAVRDARAKVEKLGLKSYTQVVNSDTGRRTRVRVGPFGSRDEADAVAAKAKRAGLPVAILTL